METTVIDSLGFKMVAALLISMAVLVVALYVIMSKNYALSEKHWVYGAVGTVVGYWLKT